MSNGDWQRRQGHGSPPGGHRPQRGGQGYQGQQVSSGAPSLRAQQIKADVLAGEMTKIDQHAEELAQRLVPDSRHKLTPSQVRNFYGSIAKLRAEDKPERRVAELRLLRSRLAYLTARVGKPAEPLWEVFGPILREAKENQVDAVCNFAEALVAYHKFYEKRGGAQEGNDAR